MARLCLDNINTLRHQDIKTFNIDTTSHTTNNMHTQARENNNSTTPNKQQTHSKHTQGIHMHGHEEMLVCCRVLCVVLALVPVLVCCGCVVMCLSYVV